MSLQIDDDADVCSRCGTRLECTVPEEWHTESGETIVVKMPFFPYILANLSSGEFCLCEECYKVENFGQLADMDIAEIHYQFALEYRRIERLSDSVDAFHKGLRLKRTADMLAGLARSYDDTGDQGLARELYNQALELEPNHFMSRENLKKL